MDDSKASPRAVKVVDRRKFTPDGEPRGESAVPQDTSPESETRPEAEKEPDAQAQAAAQDQFASDQPSPTSSQYFMGLVDSLAHQAAVLLTEGEGRPAQPAEAKKVIDYLGMLEEKTAGNLNPEEKRFLGDVMFELRSAYLKST